jgi:ABC-type multidrug transport system, ATPase component
MNVLTINNITKYYGKIRALHNVSFSVPQGAVFGILGPNGSGKTTLLGIVTDVLKATSGDFTLFDDKATPQHQLRKKIGTMLETPNFYHYLTGERNLEIAAEIKGASKAEIPEILKKVGLYERRKSKFNTYSLGMKQRLSIGSALLGSPKALILDEPTNGLDPEGIAEIRELIKQLGSEGHTIVLASHLLDEVEKVCDHVAILKSGDLLTSGKAGEILTGEDIVEISAAEVDKLLEVLKDKYQDRSIERAGDILMIAFAPGTADTAGMNAYCLSQGVIPNRLLLRKKSLESTFLELVSLNKQ